MAIISKETELQEELSQIYEEIISNRDEIKCELKSLRHCFEDACNQHIDNDFSYEEAFVSAKNRHQEKFIEYDMYCHVIEILNDYKDIYDQFPEYKEMYLTLYDVMIHLAKNEKYELAALLKIWVDKIKSVIA